MTVHIESQGSTGGVAESTPLATASASAARLQNTSVRVLAVLLAVMTGATAGLAAYIVGIHVTKASGESIVWAAATFVAMTSLGVLLEEKSGLIE